MMTMGRQFWREPAKQLGRALRMSDKCETPMVKALIERLGKVIGDAVVSHGTEAVASEPVGKASSARRALSRRRS